jgi:hypothetical protein
MQLSWISTPRYVFHCSGRLHPSVPPPVPVGPPSAGRERGGGAGGSSRAAGDRTNRGEWVPGIDMHKDTEVGGHKQALDGASEQLVVDQAEVSGCLV